MKVTNEHNLPRPVVDALTADDYTKGDSNRSVTQLIDSPRYRILKHEHKDEISMDASELIWIALGKGVHKMFEDHAGGKWKAEERLFAEHSGWVLSGAIDIQETGEPDKDGIIPVVLYDYKITSVWSVIYGKESYAQQLNFYRWLVERHHPNYKVVGLRIVFVLRDWRMRDAQTKGKDYPQAPILSLPVDMWKESDLENYVDDRVALHQEAEFARMTGDELPECTDEERWVQPSKYRVIKKGNKRAKRVFSENEKAVEYIKAEGLDPKVFEIVHEPGVANRCAMGYCPVAEWCEQWQKEKPDD